MISELNKQVAFIIVRRVINQLKPAFLFGNMSNLSNGKLVRMTLFQQLALLIIPAIFFVVISINLHQPIPGVVLKLGYETTRFRLSQTLRAISGRYCSNDFCLTGRFPPARPSQNAPFYFNGAGVGPRELDFELSNDRSRFKPEPRLAGVCSSPIDIREQLSWYQSIECGYLLSSLAS